MSDNLRRLTIGAWIPAMLLLLLAGWLTPTRTLVAASASVEPPCAPSGSDVRRIFTGTGFEPGEMVDLVEIDVTKGGTRRPFTSREADSTGQVIVQFAVEVASISKDFILEATGRRSGATASAPFRVVLNEACPPDTRTATPTVTPTPTITPTPTPTAPPTPICPPSPTPSSITPTPVSIGKTLTRTQYLPFVASALCTP